MGMNRLDHSGSQTDLRAVHSTTWYDTPASGSEHGAICEFPTDCRWLVTTSSIHDICNPYVHLPLAQIHTAKLRMHILSRTGQPLNLHAQLPNEYPNLECSTPLEFSFVSYVDSQLLAISSRDAHAVVQEHHIKGSRPTYMCTITLFNVQPPQCSTT